MSNANRSPSSNKRIQCLDGLIVYANELALLNGWDCKVIPLKNVVVLSSAKCNEKIVLRFHRHQNDTRHTEVFISDNVEHFVNSPTPRTHYGHVFAYAFSIERFINSNAKKLNDVQANDAA